MDGVKLPPRQLCQFRRSGDFARVCLCQFVYHFCAEGEAQETYECHVELVELRADSLVALESSEQPLTSFRSL